jgi:hypothetical protein
MTQWSGKEIKIFSPPSPVFYQAIFCAVENSTAHIAVEDHAGLFAKGHSQNWPDKNPHTQNYEDSS